MMQPTFNAESLELAMSKHTKGPWKVDKRGDGFAVCTRYDTLATLHYVDAEANARLIAAAPELLHELRFLVQELKALGFDGDDEIDGADLVDVMAQSYGPIKAAIKKATGGVK